MIIDELKAANVKALKEHDKNARAILSVVLSKYKLMEIELNSSGKEMSDLNTTKLLNKMLMCGKEASNRKQEIDRQHYTIPNQRPKDKHCGKI